MSRVFTHRLASIYAYGNCLIFDARAFRFTVIYFNALFMSIFFCFQCISQRSQSRRDDYSELLVEKCRYWMKDGRCPFGNKCRYDHGSTSEAKSKLKIIRSIVRYGDRL